MEVANFNSTTLSASKQSVQRARPVGGVLHATAIWCASCLPVNFACLPAPWSLIQTLKPFFNEPAARAFDRVDAAGESGDDLLVSRAVGSQQQDACARDFARRVFAAPDKLAQFFEFCSR